MREEYYSNSKDYINRWIISYADLVTLLLALFLVMFIANKSQTNDIPKVTKVDNSAIEKTLKEEFKENEIDLLKDDRGYILRLPEKILQRRRPRKTGVLVYERMMGLSRKKLGPVEKYR